MVEFDCEAFALNGFLIHLSRVPASICQTTAAPSNANFWCSKTEIPGKS
jgi:hypothetical protein